MTDQEPTEAEDTETYIAEIERLSMARRKRAEKAEADLATVTREREWLRVSADRANLERHEADARRLETVAACVQAEARLREVEQERNEAFASCDRYRLAPFGGGFRFQWQDRAEAAEAQVRELRGLIVEILQGEDDGFYWDESPGCTLTERMRAALARIPGPEPSK